MHRVQLKASGALGSTGSSRNRAEGVRKGARSGLTGKLPASSSCLSPQRPPLPPGLKLGSARNAALGLAGAPYPWPFPELLARCRAPSELAGGAPGSQRWFLPQVVLAGVTDTGRDRCPLFTETTKLRTVFHMRTSHEIFIFPPLFPLLQRADTSYFRAEFPKESPDSGDLRS